MDSSSNYEDSIRDSLNMSQQRFINAATKKSILKKKDTKVGHSMASLKHQEEENNSSKDHSLKVINQSKNI